MGQSNEDLTGHVSMALNEEKKDLNINCGEFCASGLIAKNCCCPIPRTTPDCFGNTEIRLSHVSSTGRCCLWSWTLSMAHKSGTHGSAGANHFLCQQLQNKCASSLWGSWEDPEERTRKGRNVAYWVNLICLSDTLSVHLSQQNYS